MQTQPEPVAQSKGMVWTGRVITALVALLIAFGGIMNIMKTEQAVKGAADFGIPENVVQGIGVAALVSAVLYAIPQTTVLGAILLTGYFGGAVMTHLRLNDPAVVFAPIAGVLTWLGVYLREPRLRAIAFWRR